MSDAGEPIPGQTPYEAIKPADKTLPKEEIPQRDRMLAEIERIVTIDDDEERAETEASVVRPSTLAPVQCRCTSPLRSGHSGC